MVWAPTVSSTPPLLAAAVAAAVIVGMWRRRSDDLSRAFLALMVAIWAWSVTYAIQLGFTTVSGQLPWRRLVTAMSGPAVTAWLVLTVRYHGRYERFTHGRWLGALLLEPAAYALVSLAPATAGLVFPARGSSLTAAGALDPTLGPLYYVHAAYAYVLVVAGVGLLVSVAVRSRAYRLQAFLLVLGAVLPLSGNVLYTFDLLPFPTNPTTITFAVTGAVFGLAVFRFDLLNRRPVARERVLTDLENGLVVVDDEGLVTDYNDVAARVLSTPPAVGRPARELFAVDDLADADGRLLETDGATGREYHEVRVSDLQDYRDQQVGRAVALQNVTTRRQYEQRLEVANRLLRHNLRNDMAQVIGWAEVVRDETEGHPAEAADTIIDVAEGVADLSERAREIERTLEVSDAAPTTVDAVPLVERVVDETRATTPATLSVDLPESLPVRAPSEDLLTSAVANLVENAVEHNDDDPSVRVDADRADDRVHLRVADDGPGIPDIERDTLTRRTETDLQHGSGLGLWLVSWVAESAGGDLSFASNDPRGTVAILSLPPGAPAATDDARSATMSETTPDAASGGSEFEPGGPLATDDTNDADGGGDTDGDPLPHSAED